MIIAVSCQVPLGMEDGRIADSQITASSEYDDSRPKHKTYHGANNARLNRRPQSVGNVYTTGAWCAGKKDVNQWIQVEFTIPTWVTGVLIQGRQGPVHHQWVTKYKVYYRSNKENWIYVQNNDNQDAIVSKTYYLDTSGVATGESRGQEKQEKSGRFFHFAFLTDGAGYATAPGVNSFSRHFGDK